jgi:hypothetical protein
MEIYMPKTKAVSPKSMSKEEIQAKTGLTLIYSFFTILVINLIVIFLANMFFPTSVVLGTYSLPFWWAMHNSLLVLSLIGTFVIPVVYYHEWKRGQIYTPKEWMITYFVVNVVAVYGITRFAEVLGLGIAHWWIAVILGAVLDWAQGMGMMALGKIQGQ